MWNFSKLTINEINELSKNTLAQALNINFTFIDYHILL